MNEKLRNHVNILWAAAPKNAKADEIKEELLRNLDDKYNDLLANGYDQTAAFHVALSGIGDLDELFRECGKPGQPGGQSAAPTAPQTVQRKEPTSLLVLLAVLLFVFGLTILFVSVFNGIQIDDTGIRTAGMTINNQGIVFKKLPWLFVWFTFLCWAAGMALIVYAVIRSTMSGKDETIPVPWEVPVPPIVPPPVVFRYLTKDDIAFKRIVAGILGILLGTFGVHKFYLGFVGSGLMMLLVTILSCGVLATVTWAIGVIEGIVYLLKSDRDFYRDYEVRRRNWF